MLLSLEFPHSECHLAHCGKLSNYYSLEISGCVPDIKAQNILTGIENEDVLTELEEAKSVIQIRARSTESALFLFPPKCEQMEVLVFQSYATLVRLEFAPESSLMISIHFCTAHQRSYCKSHGIKGWIFGIWEY